MLLCHPAQSAPLFASRLHANFSTFIFSLPLPPARPISRPAPGQPAALPAARSLPRVHLTCEFGAFFSSSSRLLELRSPSPLALQLVMTVMAQIEGACALLVKSTHYPGELVACKRGAPLILGVRKPAAAAACDTGALALAHPTAAVGHITSWWPPRAQAATRAALTLLPSPRAWLICTPQTEQRNHGPPPPPHVLRGRCRWSGWRPRGGAHRQAPPRDRALSGQ